MPNDFKDTPSVIRTTVPHQPGAPRTGWGSPPVMAASYDTDGVALGAASTLDDEWRSAYAVLARTEREWAALAAVHGPGGTADAGRRLVRAQVAAAMREAAHTAGTKVTEAALDDMATASDEHKRALSDQTAEGTRYRLLESERERARMVLDWCRQRAYLAAAEARLAPQGGGA